MKKSIIPGSKTGGIVSANGRVKPAKWTPPPQISGATVPLALAPTIDRQEAKELERLENLIRNGWKNFLEVGHALIRIQKDRLYRDDYATFELYCRDRLGISRPYAYSMIGSAEVYDDLSAIADISIRPVNEAQTRCLISVPKEKRVTTWKKVVEKAAGSLVTAKLVREVAVQFKGKKKGGLKTSAKRPGLSRDILSPVLRLIDEAEQAAQLKDFTAIKNILGKLRTRLMS